MTESRLLPRKNDSLPEDERLAGVKNKGYNPEQDYLMEKVILSDTH